MARSALFKKCGSGANRRLREVGLTMQACLRACTGRISVLVACLACEAMLLACKIV